MSSELQDFLVPEVPSSIYYIPNFINDVEENWILDKVNNAPKPKWTQLLNRRLQNWGGIPLPKGMVVEPLPDWLKTFTEKVSALDIFDNGKLKANHVLVNEYLPGQGIMPHLDGPLFYPTIATINCGSHTILEFEEHLAPDEVCDKKPISMLLERRSLIIVKDEMYTSFKHTIREIKEDLINEQVKNVKTTQSKIGDKLTRDTRISLTIRHVPKICKFQLSDLKRLHV